MSPHASRAGRSTGRRWLTALVLLVSAVLAVPVFVALYEAFDLFGLPGALGVLIALAAILAVAWVVHLVRTFGDGLLVIGRSIAGSLGEALGANAYVAGAGRRLARPIGFVRRRLDPRRSSGLFVTATVIVAGLLLSAFASVTTQVLHHGALEQVDARLANLSDLVHHGEPLRAATFFTLVGGAPYRIPLALAVFAVVWIRRPALRPLVGFVAVLVLAPLLSDVGRQVIRRPRPAIGASALPGSFSFPSGHAAGAASAFGYLAYLGVRSARRLRWQVAVAALAAVAIIGVGYSRVVLGFHWASDVLAGTILGLAVAAVAAAYAGVRPGRELPWAGRLTRARLVFGALALGLVGWAAVSAVNGPMRAPVLQPLPPRPLAAASVTGSSLRAFPLYSETLTGRRMEPVSLIFVGDRDALVRAFRAAGFSLADPVDLHTLLHVYSAGLRSRPYPTAPVTPAFLAGRPQDLAFERAVVAGSVRQRHHTRVWSSGFTLTDGSPIWLATASLDDRLEIKLTTLLPNHHIAPDIDTERDLIAAELRSTGLVAGEAVLQAVPPELGTNAAGDPFFTYGKAIVIDLRSASPP